MRKKCIFYIKNYQIDNFLLFFFKDNFYIKEIRINLFVFSIT